MKGLCLSEVYLTRYREKYAMQRICLETVYHNLEYTFPVKLLEILTSTLLWAEGFSIATKCLANLQVLKLGSVSFFCEWVYTHYPVSILSSVHNGITAPHNSLLSGTE